RCAAGRGCGAGLLQKGRTRTFEARVPADLHLEPGDIVRLELKPDHLLQAASLAYGVPLLGIMLGVGAASGLADADNEPLAIACGLLGLVAGVVAGRRALRREECLQNVTPVAVRRLPVPPAAGSRP